MAPQSPLGESVAQGTPRVLTQVGQFGSVRRSGSKDVSGPYAPQRVTPARADTRSAPASPPVPSSANFAGSLQAVEDQIEPELELACAVTARRGDVLAGVLGEKRVVGGRQFPEEPVDEV